MRRAIPVVLVGVLLAGCASGTAEPKPPAVQPARAQDSALTQCAAPNAARPKSVAAPLAADFSGDRVTSAISLDGGKFTATPAPDSARPQITAALALCNELAAATAQNSVMSGDARYSGFSFGLGIVTITLSIRDPYVVSGSAVTQPKIPTPAGYRRRLAWIGVGAPAVVASCPAETSPPTSAAAEQRLPRRRDRCRRGALQRFREQHLRLPRSQESYRAAGLAVRVRAMDAGETVAGRALRGHHLPAA